MPLRNRVTPTGEIVSVRDRGTMMGNRGIIHDPDSRELLTRRWQHQAWICCVLSFKGYQHPIMGRSSYTELFFLDEATAFAAGHRPCAYCRRGAFNAFKAAWVTANRLTESGSPPPAIRAPVIDRQLHRERVTRARQQVTHEAALEDLPDGVFVLHRGCAHLWSGGRLYPWSAAGYGKSVSTLPSGLVALLTPVSIVGAFRVGYRPDLHLAF